MHRAVAGVALALAVAGPAGAATPLGTPGPLVRVGPGASESSVRQAVRTPAGRVYVVAADDDGDTPGPVVVRMYKAGQDGNPTSFAEADAGDAPAAPFPATLSGVDARLDRAGVIHVAYYRSDQGAIHQTFDTNSNQWGAAELVSSASVSILNRGSVVATLALDAMGVPFVAVSTNASVRVHRRESASSWPSEEVGTAGDKLLHPSMSFDRAGRLHVAWLSEASPNAIRYASRSPAGAWDAKDELVSNESVLTNTGVLDQSPSLAVDSQNQPVLVYLDTADLIRVRTRTGSGWAADDPNPAVDTHSPGIHLRGDDRFVMLGHDIPGIDPAYISRTAGVAS
jgi:hypothetical protein